MESLGQLVLVLEVLLVLLLVVQLEQLGLLLGRPKIS
jgi:hypothetical protein